MNERGEMRIMCYACKGPVPYIQVGKYRYHADPSLGYLETRAYLGDFGGESVFYIEKCEKCYYGSKKE